MAEDQKLALSQLQQYLISLLRDLETNGEALCLKTIETDDFEFKLEYLKKRKLKLLKDEEND